MVFVELVDAKELEDSIKPRPNTRLLERLELLLGQTLLLQRLRSCLHQALGDTALLVGARSVRRSRNSVRSRGERGGTPPALWSRLTKRLKRGAHHRRHLPLRLRRHGRERGIGSHKHDGLRGRHWRRSRHCRLRRHSGRARNFIANGLCELSLIRRVTAAEEVGERRRSKLIGLCFFALHALHPRLEILRVLALVAEELHFVETRRR